MIGFVCQSHATLCYFIDIWKISHESIETCYDSTWQVPFLGT
jgi:hypothetical protein